MFCKHEFRLDDDRLMVCHKCGLLEARMNRNYAIGYVVFLLGFVLLLAWWFL